MESELKFSLLGVKQELEFKISRSQIAWSRNGVGVKNIYSDHLCYCIAEFWIDPKSETVMRVQFMLVVCIVFWLMA